MEISLQIFNKRMGEEQCKPHLEYRKKNAFVLIDEMQCMAANADVERIVRGFCRFLDTSRVPWIAVGTSELRELAWKKQDYMPLDTGSKGLGFPFNRAQFVLMPRLTFNEVATLFEDYEKARKTKMPETIKRVIEREAAGHPSSFMTLMSMFDKKKPTTYDGIRGLYESSTGKNQTFPSTAEPV